MLYDPTTHSTIEAWLAEPDEEWSGKWGCKKYPKSLALTLAQKHEIEGLVLIDLLWKKLERLGYTYLALREDINEALPDSEVRKWLNDIQQSAGELNTLTYQSLEHPKENFQLYSALTGPEIELWDQTDKANEENLKAPEFTDIVTLDLNLPSLSDLPRHLALVDFICARALEKIGHLTPGPAPPFHLNLWIDEISKFWSANLERPITVDTHGSDFLTPYGRFMSECLAPIDHAPLQAGARPSLASYLKKHRTARNRAQ